MPPPPAKRRKLASRVEEVTFDTDAREEYLTGFHKRKQERIKTAQAEAAKKERALKNESRKLRRKDLEVHVQTVNDILKRAQGRLDSDAESEDEEDNDVDDQAVTNEDEQAREDEYSDEDKYTTVLIEPMVATSDHDSDDSEAAKKPAPDRAAPKPARPKKVKKKKKFRYESKVDRKATRVKQHAKKSAAAEQRRSK